MQARAVNVSLTAGDSARMAISTSWSTANERSCVSVLCGPVACAPPSARATPGVAAAGHTFASGWPSTTKCPGRCSRRITALPAAEMSISVLMLTYCR